MTPGLFLCLRVDLDSSSPSRRLTMNAISTASDMEQTATIAYEAVAPVCVIKEVANNGAMEDAA
eukprot:CAMPEP_0183778472 /NCGR_PEP_ID=MMETSP0739-20130205/51500_1 /TAXON_ID=385413 /ORGANISM="Thalassiosira miniscula, Strain CCMP1093" /LENGTH=63 /DNA_ID=CAMNT_0026020857 /DNA_START=1506 /DNA_END=1697 /DNA_ORIENTATION=-